MSLVQALAPMVEGRSHSLENPSTSLADWAGWEFGAHFTDSDEAVTPETALTVPAMLGVVQRMSRVIYNLPVKIHRRAEDGSRDTVEDDPRGELLSRRGSANPELRAWRLRDMHVAHILLWGNAYAEVVRNGAGRATALWPIGPWRVKPERRNGRLVYRVTLPGGGQETFDQDDIIHVPGLGWDGLQGRSVISYIRQSLGLSIAAERFGSRFFGAGARPSASVTHPEQLSPEAQEKLRRTFESVYSGRDNHHRIVMLDEGMQWESIGVPPEDAQFLETRRLQVEDVARATGFPPHMLGLETPRSGANLEEQNREFVTYVLSPWLTPFEAEWRAKLFPGEELWAEHDLEGLLEGNSEARTNALRERLVTGAITLNEWRRIENRPPYPPDIGDVPLIQGGMVTVEEQVQGQPEIGAPDEGTGVEENAERSQATAPPRWERRDSDALMRVREAFRETFRAASQRMVRVEVDRIRRMVGGFADNGDAERFGDAIMEFYEEHRERVRDEFLPVIRSYAEANVAVVERVFGGSRDLDPQLEDMVAEYAEDMGTRWVSRNRSIILRRLNEDETEEAVRAIEEALDRWEEDRADFVANEEVVRSQGAVTREAFKAANVDVLQWNTDPDPCPLCDAMGGTRVSIARSFLGAGDAVSAAGETFQAPSTISHPPLHDGCNCFLTPG